MMTPVQSELETGREIFLLREVVKRRAKGGNCFELSIPHMAILPGEFVAIVGESGCGKSTMLDMLALVLSPSSASSFVIRIPSSGREADVAQMRPSALAEMRKTNLGYVLQTGGLLPFLTVKQNILLPCRINGMSDTETHVARLCNRLKISEQLSKKPQFLSGGQRQRVAIARALAHQPPIVLADEPTAAVDKLTAREIRDTFKDLTQQLKVTVIMVTHDVDLIADVADRIFTFDVRKPGLNTTFATCIEKTNRK